MMDQLRITFALYMALLPVAWAQQPTPAKPDVLLITIDTLRADRVGCFGAKPSPIPTLDALCRDGIRFPQAISASSITNTSHASILSGQYPSRHGVSDFAVPLPPTSPTIAELLRKQGYRTAAFIGAAILDSTSLAPGFDRGFDHYDNFTPKR